jgi:hypothetical protein
MLLIINTRYLNYIHKMAELITEEGIIYAQTIKYAVSSVFTSLLAGSLDNIVHRNKEDVPSFLKRNICFSSCNNFYLQHVRVALNDYYKTNNKTYPDSFLKLNLDITNLSAIQTNLFDSEDDIDYLFYIIRNIRNKSHHLKNLSKLEFTTLCDRLRKMIPEFMHLNNEEQEIYLFKLNYVLKNLVITDVQFLKIQFEKIDELFCAKDNENFYLNNKMVNLENEVNEIKNKVKGLKILLNAKDLAISHLKFPEYKEINDLEKLQSLCRKHHIMYNHIVMA